MKLLRGVLVLAVVLSVGGVTAYAGAAEKKPSERQLKLAYEHQEKGNSLDEQGMSAEAIEEYKQALRFNPEDANTFFNLGTVYLKINKPDEAVKSFEEVLKREKNDTEAMNLLGLAYRGCGKTQEAIKTWEKSLSIDPRQSLPKKFIEEAKAQ